ncbi:MAG: hypothetical protein R2754_15515 [Microthrixaceae bacterium]
MATAINPAAGTTTRAAVTAAVATRSAFDGLATRNRLTLYPTTANRRCAPPGKYHSRMWVVTIATMPTARSTTLVSKRPKRRRCGAGFSASSAMERRCQSAGSAPSTSSRATAHSTYESESPPSETKESRSSTRPRPRIRPKSAASSAGSCPPLVAEGAPRSVAPTGRRTPWCDEAAWIAADRSAG